MFRFFAAISSLSGAYCAWIDQNISARRLTASIIDHAAGNSSICPKMTLYVSFS